MNGLIRETNENLKIIIDTMKENLDSAINVLDNIQSQMDKKVEEAKNYKIQVDSAKDNIRKIEEDNRNLEISLTELNEKYGKLNLVSIIETGNKEIKAKINENIKEINKNKEQIAELTSKAKTIKDLLINLKKDKTTKEERLENIKKVYEFYSKNLNDLMEYAYEHSENLDSASYNLFDFNSKENIIEDNYNNDLESTMVFDAIADIDENDDFKDEITFINDEIESNIVEKDYNSFVEKINNDANINIIDNESEENDDFEEESSINLDELESTQVFESIMDPDNISFDEELSEEIIEESPTEDIEEETNIEQIEENEEDNLYNFDINDDDFVNEKNESNEETVDETELDINFNEDIDKSFPEDISIDSSIELENAEIENIAPYNEEIKNEDLNVEPIVENNNDFINNLNIGFDTNNDLNTNIDENENTQFDLTTNNRIDEISDLLSNIENTEAKTVEMNNIEERIHNVLNNDSELEEEKQSETILDIFGNPIKAEEIDTTIKESKRIEDLFVENGVDFNKFKEDEQSYLKQIYDENKFVGIFNILNKNKINVDNLYHSFNIFGEIDFIELDNIINKLLNIGQSVESIGIILEKMPKIKKYNLDEAIASFNDEIKNVNITELIMRAKELYNNGGNK